ncbi:MAG: sialate O-acetylesterase [Aureliella sp.]
MPRLTLGPILMFLSACTAWGQVDVGSAGDLRLAGLFDDHMVLQRECNAAIWGTATPGATIDVAASWSKQPVQATTDQNGKWTATIQTPAAGGPFTIRVKSGSQQQLLSDVLVGEVWICAGQSNMQWKLRGFGVDHFAEDVQKANYPQIRFCDVPQVIALREQDNVDARWSVCSPKSALAFSAVGYFFGSRLYQELDVPIGLISTNWGGSSAEAWVSPEVLKNRFPEFDSQFAANERIAERTGTLFSRANKPPAGLNQRNPSVLYNSMIQPLIPYKFRGVVWYQGESNVRAPLQYRTLFPALIQDWRTRWGQGDFPFYFVQIAPFGYKQEPVSAAFLREAQTMALALPNTGMVVTMDIGNPSNIHPKEKKPVGERLALLALKHDYQQKHLVASGPMVSDHSVENGAIRIRFSDVGGGLVSRDGRTLSHFTIAGADRCFVDAKATVDGDTIIVRSDQVKAPVAVRFAWGSGDAPNLSNKAGLPASSFRTDDWPIKP